MATGALAIFRPVGYGNGYGDGDGNGYGNGNGYGYGDGNGYGYGYGNGYGTIQLRARRRAA